MSNFLAVVAGRGASWVVRLLLSSVLVRFVTVAWVVVAAGAVVITATAVPAAVSVTVSSFITS